MTPKYIQKLDAPLSIAYLDNISDILKNNDPNKESNIHNI